MISTEEQNRLGIRSVENLQILAKCLDSLPANDYFDMGTYLDPLENVRFNAVDNAIIEYTKTGHKPCGTAACAVGHAPHFGIGDITAFADNDDGALINWYSYSNQYLIEPNNGTGAWNWCFSPDWAALDNTPQGAAKRIRYLLEQGVPATFTGSPKKDDLALYED